jgi:hypothetical protein
MLDERGRMHNGRARISMIVLLPGNIWRRYNKCIMLFRNRKEGRENGAAAMMILPALLPELASGI